MQSFKKTSREHNIEVTTLMTSLTINHRQSSFVQKPEPPVFEQPDGQDGEGEEQDEDEQVCAVLPVALLSLFLCNDVLHGTVLLR